MKSLSLWRSLFTIFLMVSMVMTPMWAQSTQGKTDAPLRQEPFPHQNPLLQPSTNAPHRELAYVTDATNAIVRVLDTSNLKHVATIPVGGGPIGVVFRPDHLFAYVLNVDDHTISVIDTSKNMTVTTLISEGGLSTSNASAAMRPNSADLYVLTGRAGRIYVVNTLRHLIVDNFSVINGPAWGIAITPDGKRAYVTSALLNAPISVLDLTNNTLITTVVVGTQTTELVQMTELVMTKDGTRVFAVENQTGSVIVIDTSTNTIVKRIPVGHGAYGIAITPNANRVYVTNPRENTVSVIDARTYDMVAKIKVGKSPTAISFAQDGSRGFVTNSGDGTVSVLDTSALNETVLDTVVLGGRPTAIAISQFGFEPNRGTITIRKETQPKSMQDFSYYGPFGKFFLDDAVPDDGDSIPNSVTYIVNPGTYNFAEGVFQAWYLADIACVGSGQSTKDMLNRSLAITVNAGQQMTCTFVTQRRVNLQAIKFNDLNGDSLFTFNEPTLFGWEMVLYNSQNMRLLGKVTDSSGSTVFNNRIPGTYKLCETPKVGWSNTLPGAIDASLARPCYTFTLQPGQNAVVIFGNTQGAVVRPLEEIDPNRGVIVSDLPDINEAEGETPVDGELQQQSFLPMISR